MTVVIKVHPNKGTHYQLPSKIDLEAAAKP